MTLYFFNAKWCGACHAMKKTVEEVAKDKGIEYQSIDVDTESEMAEKYAIRSVPTLLFLNNDKQTRLYGNQGEEAILEALESIE